MRPSHSQHPLWLLVVASSCSLNDLSYLQSNLGEGGGAHGGSSGDSQTSTGGRSGSDSGSGTMAKGGTSNRAGSTARGGATTAATTTTGGASTTGGMTAIGGAGNAAVPYGPWTFDTAADLPQNWIKGRAGVRVSWLAEGETPPLGSLTIDSSASDGIADIRHTIDPTNLSKQTVSARVRMAYGEGIVQFYATTATTYGSGYGPEVPVGTDWTTISWAFNQPAKTNGIYDPTRITFILLLLAGTGVLWVDGISLSPPVEVPTGTGGSTST